MEGLFSLLYCIGSSGRRICIDLVCRVQVLEACHVWDYLVFHIRKHHGVDGDRLGAVTKSQQCVVACLLVEDGGSKLLQMMIKEALVFHSCGCCEEG